MMKDVQANQAAVKVLIVPIRSFFIAFQWILFYGFRYRISIYRPVAILSRLVVF
jgi:hypothetical protein